jgi:hypothetical protein
MADDATDVGSEITLDDFNADEQPSEMAEPSPAMEEAKAELKAEEQPKAEPTEEKEIEGEKADVADDTDEPVPDETKAEAEVPQKAEQRKEQLNTEIRDLVAQKNALKAEVEKKNAEVYQVASVDELTEQGLSDSDAKVEALRQQYEMDKYNSQVADAQLTLSSEAERVLNDFPVFNPESKGYDKELAEEAATLLEANLDIDQNTGQIIGSRVSPYQLYKTLARASTLSTTKGQLKGQQATEKMLANADSPSTATKPQEKVDPLMALWKSDD